MEGKRTSISVVILTKNEEVLIAECIKAIQKIDPLEIIVIDDNSDDGTVSIAQYHGARVERHKKIDFAEARNFGLSQAKAEWVLYIDADEIITDSLSKEIISAVKHDTDTAGYYVTRINYFLGKRWPGFERLLRMVRKSHFIDWFGKVHETARVNGRTQIFFQELSHYTHRDISEMVENTVVWSETEAQLRLDADHPGVVWWRFPRVMIPTIFNYLVRQSGWKIGTVGLIESLYQSFSLFITYARLWEMQQIRSRK